MYACPFSLCPIKAKWTSIHGEVRAPNMWGISYKHNDIIQGGVPGDDRLEKGFGR